MGTGRTVLAIEDSPSVRRLIEVCLRSENTAVLTADDGPQGLDLASDLEPDLILLDIGLPGIDGWEVLRRLRAEDATREIPVLVLTAHAQPEVEEQAEERGVQGFMTKPFRPADLRAAVDGILGPE